MNKIDIEKISEGNHKAYSELIETLEKVKDAIKKQNYGIAMDILCKPYPAFQVITLSSESKDEKIRKGIIKYLEQSQFGEEPYSIDDDTVRDYIDWLEKQGEQKPFPKFKIGDMVKRKDNPHLTYILKRSTDDGDYEFHAIGKDGNEGCTHFAAVKYQDEWELVEQKPAWSEEDKAVLDALIRRLEGEDVYVSPHLAAECLKSLKDRVQPQNFTVTDEELIKARNEAYNDALDKLEYHSDTPTFNDGWSAAIWYLKKRKALPQNRWKPSDEQMQALSNAGNSFRPFEKGHKVLWSLYEELKKLKG